MFSSPNNVVDVKDINTSDIKKDIENNLNPTQSQIQQNISQMTSTASLASSSANSTLPTPLPPPIKSTASELPKIENTVNLEIENLFLEGIRNELPKLDISIEEDQFYRQLMEECIRTIKAYTYVSEKHLSNSTLKNAEREMNRAKKKYEKEKNRRIRLLEKAIKDKNKAQKEKERAIEKAEREAKQQARLKAKAEKEKEKKEEKSTAGTTTTVSTKEEKTKSNLPSITSFFTVKPSKQSSSNNNKITINNQNNKNTTDNTVLINDVKDVDLAYQNTVKYLEICNKKTYDIDKEFKEFINKKKTQRKKKVPIIIKYHTKDNKLIQIIGTSRNGHRIPTMSYIEDKTSKVITGRHPLKCDPYVSYSFEDIDENSDDEEGDEDNVDDEEGEDLSQADSNEEEEEIELEEEAKEEGKNVNELDYHDGFLDSEENDQVMHLMNKINTGQRVAIIIQPYFGDMSDLPKELLALKIIKI